MGERHDHAPVHASHPADRRGALRHARIVLISGARQVGKTTLSTEIAATDHPMRTLTLDDGLTLQAALQDPAGFIAGLNGPVLIDEIQRAPGLLLEIKKAVDRDTTPGRFLLTGSADCACPPRPQSLPHLRQRDDALRHALAVDRDHRSEPGDAYRAAAQ
jgi:predicted AAA+ superfamily ATPase